MCVNEKKNDINKKNPKKNKGKKEIWGERRLRMMTIRGYNMRKNSLKKRGKDHDAERCVITWSYRIITTQ